MAGRIIASIGSAARTITWRKGNGPASSAPTQFARTTAGEAGLDYIVGNGGTITEAVSSMAWSGEANVHVSIVNWMKGSGEGQEAALRPGGQQSRCGMAAQPVFDKIGPSLSFSFDVTQARRIEENAKRGGCFQGQTHGHKAFLMPPGEAKLLIAKRPEYADVVFPFLIAEDLIGEKNSKPTRYVIDFQGKDVIEAQTYKETCFSASFPGSPAASKSGR